MLSVQMAALFECDEELRPVGVWSFVRHRQDTSLRVASGEALIRKVVLTLKRVDGLASSSISLVAQVSSLDHKIIYDPMELGAEVMESLGS